MALDRAQLAAQLCHDLVHVVEFRARWIAEHLAVIFGHLLLSQTQIGARLQDVALRLEKGLRALRLQQHQICRLHPQGQHLSPGFQGFSLVGLLVEALGEGSGRAHPGVKHHGVVLEIAPPQGNPGVEQTQELALDVPQIGKARPLGEALKRLVHVVGRGEPEPRIEDLAEHLRDDRIWRIAFLQVPRYGRGQLGGR